MSAAPVAIVDPRGNRIAEAVAKITNVLALPSVWRKEATVEWLVDGMIPRQGVTLISAESGTGKTWLAYGIAGAVAHGTTFLGRPVCGTPVLYLDGENPLAVVKRNLTDLGIPETPDLHVWAGWNEDPPPGPDDPRIISFVRECGPLLIWDSLVEFAECDEQSSTEVRRFMKKFRYLAHQGATIIILHHTGKSKSSREYRGSSDIKASVDMAYVVTGSTRAGKLHRLTMDPFKSRIAPGQKFGMEFLQGRGFTPVAVANQTAKPDLDPDQIVRRIVREHPNSNGTQIKALAKPLGVGKTRVDEILSSGGFTIRQGKGAAKLYSLADEQVPDLPDPRVEEIRKSQDTP